MSSEERNKRIETMRILIKAECQRVIELLDTKEDLSRYSFGQGTPQSSLRSKMLELRKDTIRLDHLMYNYGYLKE